MIQINEKWKRRHHCCNKKKFTTYFLGLNWRYNVQLKKNEKIYGRLKNCKVPGRQAKFSNEMWINSIWPQYFIKVSHVILILFLYRLAQWCHFETFWFWNENYNGSCTTFSSLVFKSAIISIVWNFSEP